jgi:hypothetical protein
MTSAGFFDWNGFRGLTLEALKQKMLTFFPFSGHQIRRIHAHVNTRQETSDAASVIASAQEQRKRSAVISCDVHSPSVACRYVSRVAFHMS